MPSQDQSQIAPRWPQLARPNPERVGVGLYLGSSRAERPVGEQLAGQTLLYSYSMVYPTQVNRGQGSICASGGASKMIQFHVWWAEGPGYLSLQSVVLQLFPGEQGPWYSEPSSSALRLKKSQGFLSGPEQRAS